jgi:hypothetical protein
MTLSPRILTALFLGSLLVTVCATTAQTPAASHAGQVRITVAKVATAPKLDSVIPSSARYPAEFDPRELGRFSKVASRISALTVTWADSKCFKSDKQAEDLLRELMASANTQTWNYHAWSLGDGVPALIATVEHVTGRAGMWVVWCQPSLTWAYQDPDGKWWWGAWDDLKAPKPKSLATTSP